MGIQQHREAVRSPEFGAHCVEVEGNLVRIQLHGLFDEQHAREFYALLARVRSQRGSVYCVADMHEAGPPTQGARRHIVACFRGGQRIDAFVYIGANIMVRSMITLLFNAARLWMGSAMDTPIRFLSSDTEALSWLSTLHPGPQPASASDHPARH